MQGGAWLFFTLFAVVLILTYMSIRREWASPAVTAALSMMMSMTSMMLTALAQGNPVYQAVIVGLLVGGLFSGATLAVAWYFHTSARRVQSARQIQQGDGE